MPKSLKKPGVSARQANDAALERRAQFLLSNLGFDPRESISFRVMSSLDARPSAGALGILAADTPAALAMINSSGYVSEPLTEEGVWIHPAEVASTRYIADRFAFLSERTVANIADDCQRGIAFMTRHNVGGAFEGPGENPYGRTFAGQVDRTGGRTRALAQFYMQRGHTPNGQLAPSTDDIHRSLAGGTLFDFSTGLTRGGLDLRTCDICNNEIFSLQCSHCPGTVIGMSTAEIAAQVARGVPDGKATFTFDDWHAGEISGVFNGAIPNSGTALAAGRGAARTTAIQLASGDTPAECACCADDSIECGCASKDDGADGACNCDSGCTQCSDNGCDGSTNMAAALQEEPMFTKELKLSLGLAESATDAEVTAKIMANASQVTTLSTQNETLLASQKAQADATFTAKWTEKLGAETVASLLALPNREDLATNFATRLDAAGTTTAAPPIGDPLRGTNTAAAPATERQPGMTEESTIFMRQLGKFKSPAEVKKYAEIGPIAALERWLSTSGTPVTLVREPFHESFEKQTVDRRLRALGY